HYTPARAEGAALWTDATYYAKFDHNTTTLTITNTGMSGHGEQGAIFTITGKGYESGLKIAVPNGQSVTIAGVYVGETYEITEEGSWSWRYTQKSVTTKALASGGNYCTITNVPNGKNKWLSDCAWSSTAAFVTPDGTDVTPDEQSGGEG
ncbi:MAG: hypothetical protein II784_01590, partial [Oscillospiraceae bacterium]|nr:hypothetical protein [Oscillospiraceae bacterium]